MSKTEPVSVSSSESKATHIFASADWFDALERTVAEVVAYAAASGALDPSKSFSMCEVYSEIPASVNSAAKTAWWMHVAGGKVKTGRSEIDDVDLKIEASYDVALQRGAAGRSSGADG